MPGVIESVSVANRNVLWTGQKNVSADYLQRFDVVELELEDRIIDLFYVIEVNDVCIVGYELGVSPNISYVTRESVKGGRLLAREACLLYGKLLEGKFAELSERLRRIEQRFAKLLE